MLKLRNISFAYDKKVVIRNISFRIEKGETVSVIGASGCGKSTLLQIIYGLHDVQGEIWWGDKQLLGPNFNLVPGEEFIKYLSQDFDLMPSLSVAENVGKYLSNMYPRRKQRRIKELLHLVELNEFSDIKAKSLSGGQQQRVALARVLASPPEILLLDEPFSHIDHFRRNKLRRSVFSYLKENGITCLTATHDSTDALSFAQRTFAMKEGRIIADGTPQHLYNHPRDLYIASLFGEVNELPLNLLLPVEGSRKKVILYPHEIKADPGEGMVAIVKRSFYKGNNYLIEAEAGNMSIFFEHPEALQESQTISLKVSPDLIRTRTGVRKPF